MARQVIIEFYNMSAINKVYIATSLDGYISDKHNGLEWLSSIQVSSNNDMGYKAFMNGVDAVIMGRKTFETVCSFDLEWPYSKPVFVLSRSMKSISNDYAKKVELVNGPLKFILEKLNQKGFQNLYIDGGKTIQSFLKEDLIDELTITIFPIMLGGGSRLFEEMPVELEFDHIKTEVFSNQIVQSHYKRKRKKINSFNLENM